MFIIKYEQDHPLYILLYLNIFVYSGLTNRPISKKNNII